MPPQQLTQHMRANVYHQAAALSSLLNVGSPLHRHPNQPSNERSVTHSHVHVYTEELISFSARLKPGAPVTTVLW